MLETALETDVYVEVRTFNRTTPEKINGWVLFWANISWVVCSTLCCFRNVRWFAMAEYFTEEQVAECLVLHLFEASWDLRPGLNRKCWTTTPRSRSPGHASQFVAFFFSFGLPCCKWRVYEVQGGVRWLCRLLGKIWRKETDIMIYLVNRPKHQKCNRWWATKCNAAASWPTLHTHTLIS